MAQDLLTEAEMLAMDMTNELFNLVVRHVMGGDSTLVSDANELGLHIHGIQNMILAQAAGRAYPDKYRLLGKSIK